MLSDRRCLSIAIWNSLDKRPIALGKSLPEINLRRRLRALIRLEVRLLFESHQPGDHNGRKPAARSVVVLRRQGVIAARRRQTVLSASHFILKLEKTFVPLP